MFYKGKECLGSARITLLGPSLQSLGHGEQNGCLVRGIVYDSAVHTVDVRGWNCYNYWNKVTQYKRNECNGMQWLEIGLSDVFLYKHCSTFWSIPRNMCITDLEC